MYVVCMCMYVCGNFCKIDNCIHIHWRIPMGLGHNDPWAQSHMWLQQMWGQRSSRGQWPLVQVLAKRFTVSTYFDVFSWDLDKMILGHSHTCDLNRCGVKGHLGVNDLWFKFFLQKRSLYPHTLMYFHGTWTQWSLGRVTHKTSTDVGSKVI